MLNNLGNEEIFNMMPQQMGSPITEQEIQNHKIKLNNLVNKLINTHNIDEEAFINNEINNETGCLSSLLKIKRNEINQNAMNNVIMNNNLIQQQLMLQNQAMMQNMFNNNFWSLSFLCSNFKRNISISISINPDELFKEAINMFKMKIGSNENFIFIYNAKRINPELKICQTGLQNYSKITVISNNFNDFVGVLFRYFCHKDNHLDKVVKIPFYPGEKISEIIERFRASTSNRDKDLKFIFNAKNLNPNSTIKEAGITEDSNIFVVSIKGIKKEKEYKT